MLYNFMICDIQFGLSLYLVGWNRDWTVGLDSQKVALMILGDWNDRKNTASTYWVFEFFIATSCHFDANLLMFVVYNSWPNVDFGGTYGIDYCLKTHTQGCATRLEKDELFLYCYQVWLGWCNCSADCINMGSHPQTDYPLSIWERH